MLIYGDCAEELKKLEDNTIDSMVTDPPAGIGFLNKSWDKAESRDHWILWLKEIMQESLRVLKPGGHALVWALPRTSHWTATALEDAGFEIRDSIVSIFGTGFPKSLNISKAIDKMAGAEREKIGRTRDATKQWDGWGSALKPAHESWILCRKPIEEKTIAENVVKWRTGGLNIDETRVNGRFPANLILSHHQDCEEICHNECVVKEMDEHTGILKTGKSPIMFQNRKFSKNGIFSMGKFNTSTVDFSGDSGGASRYFYCSKSSRKDRGENNHHPTVKSTKLMEYLIKLITPPNGIVLDPFMGSGSTLLAAKRLGFKYIGIEKELEYFAIAEKRINNG
jgi:site-specific DNA-methyltransferase (adenine-specific)